MSADQNRSRAIDVMRGLTLALMIVVNMSIDDVSYGPLQHARWHGLTLTDTVFPTFLFVVGAALSYAFGKYQRQGEVAVLGKIARRVGLIFLCGYLLYWFPFFGADAAGQFGVLPISHTRVLGVLQRIALCYGLAALIVHYGERRGAVLFSIAALLAYWWLLHTFGDYSLIGNAVLQVDLRVLGPDHMYHGEGIAFDPEGILSTLPAIVNVLAGYLAGRFIQQQGHGYSTIAKLTLAGVIAVIAALVWNEAFPINKKLWTSSYVLCTVGIDLIVLAFLVWAIDLLKFDSWAGFFEILGRNTLFIYLLSEVGNSLMWIVHVHGQAAFAWAYEHLFRSWAGAQNGALLYALSYMLCCWAVAWELDRRRIYIRF